MTTVSTTATGTWPEDLGRRETALLAMRLRRDGKTWDEVAAEAGYSSKQAAFRAVKRVLDRVEGETVDDYREVVSARYEALYAKAWEAIETAGAKGQLVGKGQLIAAARGVLDSHAKLLGLTAPAKADVTVHTRSALDDEIEKLLDAARGNQTAAEPQEAQ